MANTNAPFGFKDTGLSGGTTPSAALRKFKIASNNSTKIYRNDPVKQLSTGYGAQWTAGTAASQLLGVFVGCEYLSSSQGKVVYSPYWPGADAAADATGYVVPCNAGAPTPTFIVQSSGTAITLADIGSNADVTIGTGSTLTGQSGATLDQSTLAVTATLPFRVMDVYQGLGNGADTTSSYNIVVVAANTVGNTGI